LENEFHEIPSSPVGLKALFFPVPKLQEREGDAERFVEKRGNVEILP
jgi:hypothetical protein